METAVIILCFQRRIRKNLLDMRDFIQVSSGDQGFGKTGFIKSDEGPATIMSEFVDFEDEESCLELISEYKLENKNCVTD